MLHLQLHWPSITLLAPLKSTTNPRFSIQSLKSSASSSSVAAVSEAKAPLELTKKNKPTPAEVSRTIMELSSVATLSTATPDGWPLGIGVRFVVDSLGTPILCFHHSNNAFPLDDVPSSLHVQLEQCGIRTPQCTLLGKLAKIDDKVTSEKHYSLWKRNFGEEVSEDLMYTVSVDRVLHMEDFGEDGLWVASEDYKVATPDPLRGFAEKLVTEINENNMEDVHRFCNIYADLDFQVLDAKLVWVDRLGFDIRVRSPQNGSFEVRIPFPGEVTDEKGAKSTFNCMSQLAWEVEKNYHARDFEKVKQLKKVVSRSR